MDTKSLKGIAVVSVNDGAKLGAISDTLFDMDNKLVRAFVVGSGGLFGGNDRILDRSDVQSIGADAVMIESRDTLIADRDDTRYQAFPSIGKVTSLRVVTAGGDVVGDLATIHFNPTDGQFTDIEVSRHGLLSTFRSNLIVPADSVIRFGQDVAVVPDQYAETVDGESKETRTTDSSDQAQSPTESPQLD